MNSPHIGGRWMAYEMFPGHDSLPRFGGVYAVYFGDELVYLGSSSNVANRLAGHKFRHSYGPYIITPWGDVPNNTRIVVKVKRSARRGDWAMWEIRLIYRLCPRFNRQHLDKRAAA